MNILIAGDFCPQDRVVQIIADGNIYDFEPIKKCISLSDYSIVNLECPVIKAGNKPIAKCGPNLHCTEESAQFISWLGFHAVTLANNHILDYGEDGVENTISFCRKNQIDYVGTGENEADAANVLYADVNGCKLAVVNCCEHEYSIASASTAGANALNPIKQFHAIKEAKRCSDFVLVVVHGGVEHFQLPTPRMKETYRFFIDAGADAVVNHHQHCFSGYEVYHDKPIFYGLGNFCFDNPHYRNSIWNEGYMVSINTSCPQDFAIIPYRQCDENATVEPIGLSDIQSKLEEFNAIIASDENLISEYDALLKRSAKHYETFFAPYSGRIMRALFRRGLLPSFLSKKRKLALYDFIACESHVDRVLHLLKI